MYFQAETNGINYEITVRESREHWYVGIKQEGQDWIYHEIHKSDYQHMDETISFIYKNSSYLVDVVGEDTHYVIYTRGSYRTLKIYNEEMLLHESLKRGGTIDSGEHLTSGMPGKISKLMVKKGDEVQEGDPLLIMEAMKMENEMRAGRQATIKKIHVKEGDNVEGGAVLISFE